ncbi:hypothetical protein OH77DRAFT_1479015 [Trametes cingulata]|nr:hypothetical protein OH77DRAFT_1479015 [Trametes cingulata]
MSRTATVAPRTTRIARSTSSLLLSPSKRRRVEDATSSGNGQPSRMNDREQRERTDTPEVAPAEIHRWTFTKAAVAACFIRDVFEMRASGSRDMEFFWLGRIPCRTVSLVGLVVGVQVWEKRTVYTVDDSTAVIDCAHAHAQVTPPSPVKPSAKGKAVDKGVSKSAGPSFADYLPSARAKPFSTATSARNEPTEPPPPPRPIARVGQSVRVVGRVVSRHDTRLLLVDEISLCVSSNDEPAHWLTVSEMHRTTYHPKEKLPPFVPPPLPTASTYPSDLPPSIPGSPSKRGGDQHTQEPGTPSSLHSSIASTNTSPSTIASASSPASSTAGQPQSPVRLRHPARLHTRDLTVHTLRIYIKHYMDNAPPPKPRSQRSSSSRSVSPSPSPRSSQARSRQCLEMPTKSHPGRAALLTEETPRPSRLRPSVQERTPRASLLSEAETDTEDEDDSSDTAGGDDQVYGYTLSHLRRVPELALLARRVVQAEAHRRAKEERKKTKSQTGRSSQTRDKSQADSSDSSIAKAEEAALTDPKALADATKRLFRQAIRTLFQDGSIVLWDGPVRPMPVPALDPLVPSSFSSALWKANTSTSTSSSMSTSISSAKSSSRSSRSISRYDEWDEEAPLSDPEPGEEAYVPLTPAYFSRVLERAITTIVSEASRASSSSASASASATPKPARKPPSLIERLRAQESGAGAGGAGGTVAGPTAAELLTWLRNSDERWARVGLWSVEEALEWGKRDGRLWCVGKGRWEVCG